MFKIRQELKGPLFLGGSVLFSAVTIYLVMWDIERQREKRTRMARFRIQYSAQQNQNLVEYMEQKQKFEDYKRAAEEAMAEKRAVDPPL